MYKWILAILITLTAVVYQRMTGPTYPVKGHSHLGDIQYTYQLKRSYSNDSDCPISLKIADTSVAGILKYRRFKTDDPWIQKSMDRTGDQITAFLPHQPAAGKLQYQVILQKQDQIAVIPSADDYIIIRFKNPVPKVVLVPHIFFMFFGMLFSNRAAFECFQKNGSPMKYAWWTFVLLFIGGMLFGPIVQWYAFGDPWTGFPIGIDLTDNKTLISMFFWILALSLGRKNAHRARIFVLIAAIITLVIFSIPHSLLGSELDFQSRKVVQG